MFLAQRMTFDVVAAASCLNGSEMNDAIYRFFNYRVAVEKIRNCQARAYVIQKELDGVANFTQDERNTVNSRLGPLNKGLSKLEQDVIGGGWQRMADKQKSTSEKALIFPGMTDLCKARFTSFLAIPLTNESNYQENLFLFQQLYQDCLVKKPS